MPRQRIKKPALSAAERQQLHRDRRKQQSKRLLSMVVAHFRFRAQVLVALERRRQSVYRFAEATGVDASHIELGDDRNYGLFAPEEIREICRVLPHLSPPKTYWDGD